MGKIIDDLLEMASEELKKEQMNIHASKAKCIQIYRESAFDIIGKSFYKRMYIAQNGISKYLFTVNGIRIYIPYE
jgi:hypothetical protein